MTDSPKQRFNKTTHSKTWAEVVDNPQFKAAADAAILQYGVKLGTPKEMNEAAANEFRRQGARDFLETLTGLAILSEPEAKPKSKTVDHTV